jgi:hypothetical protein
VGVVIARRIATKYDVEILRVLFNSGKFRRRYDPMKWEPQRYALRGAMFKVENITKDWKEAGSLAGTHQPVRVLGRALLSYQIRRPGFRTPHWRNRLREPGSCRTRLRGQAARGRLPRAGRQDSPVSDSFKHNRPAIPHAEYENPLVRAAVEQRSAFSGKSKADRLYSIDIYWVVMIDGSYQKTGLLHALSQLAEAAALVATRLARSVLRQQRANTCCYEQIERDRLRLQQKVKSLSGQLSDLTTVELLGAEKTFRLVRRLVNFRPSKIRRRASVWSASSRLAGVRLGVGSASRLPADG